MDLTLYFFISILMAIGTIIIGKKYGRKKTSAIERLSFLALILPVVLTGSFAIFKMMNANPEETEEISNKAVTQIIDYAAEKLPYIVVSDFAGIIAGTLLIPFVGNKSS